MKAVILGAHSLSVMFTIDNPNALDTAMRETARRGGKIFEIVFILCTLDWNEVAKSAKKAGIEEISLCHFWTKNEEGISILGDPLGKEDEAALAIFNLSKIMEAVEIIRKNGIIVRYVVGPTWGCLGHDYTNMTPEVRKSRVVEFLKSAADICEEHKIMLAVEFLRSSEDKVTGGPTGLMEILKAVNRPSCVSMHFDIFHCIELGLNPGMMIRAAKFWITYLHLHGDMRIAPGATGDRRSWSDIASAVSAIDSGVDIIPGVPEPFGEETCRENPALGKGIPRPPPLAQYLDEAYLTLRKSGMPILLGVHESEE